MLATRILFKQYYLPIRNGGFRLNNRARSNVSTFLYDRAVTNSSTHSNRCAILNCSSPDNDTMTNNNIFAN